MIWEVFILKSGWLFHIYFFFQIYVQKGTFDMQEEELAAYECCESNQDSYSLHSINIGKCRVITDAFFVIIALNNQLGIVPNDNPIFIKIIPEHPPSPYDDSVSRSWEQLPYLAPLKLIKFIFYLIDPFNILQCFFHILLSQ